MGKHIGVSVVLIFLLFFLPWLWGEPSQAAPAEPPDLPEDAQDPPPDQTPPPDPPDPPAASIDEKTSLNEIGRAHV